MTSDRFPEYTTTYISGAMSLRAPQTESLEILERILEQYPPKKREDTMPMLEAVHGMFPTCTDFERAFPSLTFALATGVGKTRLIGAFIALLYTRYDIKNFFVVAPSTTIFEKLKRDLSDRNSPKYVFRGLGCFAKSPWIITDDDYRTRQSTLFDSDVRIFIYNIDKFNKEGAKMRQVNEFIGDSFTRYLSALPDLVLIMDESHHYRAEKGAAALEELQPALGLELTATPLVTKGSKQMPFCNVVYEYPLSKAIADGFTRTPFAVTRADIDFYRFGEEQMDKMMLSDGILCHEHTKERLTAYAELHDVRKVKPFMLVVCKDTEHAAWVEQYVKSSAFRDGAYENKTIVVHSKQRGAESEENLRLLLDVENPENPIEIVIHVNMLKEGWDVNNLYTIVPLRTAASRVLREQMVGRGLRLPYGERTGDTDVDAVMLTAHDKFDDILSEARKEDSIFNAGNVIRVEELEKEKTIFTQMSLNLPTDAKRKGYEKTSLPVSDEMDAVFEKADAIIWEEVEKRSQEVNAEGVLSETAKEEIVQTVRAQMEEDKDLAETYRQYADPLEAFVRWKSVETHRASEEKYIPIPRIRITDPGEEEYVFVDFDIDLKPFKQVPVSSDLLRQNLQDRSDRQRIKGNSIDFEGYQPQKKLMELLRDKPEVDYERCAPLLQKLVTQVCRHFHTQYGENGLMNIVMMNRRELASEIYSQMLREDHFYCKNGFLREEVMDLCRHNKKQQYTFRQQVDLFDEFTGDIHSVLFTGIKKGVFRQAKFDSKEGELYLARILEQDPDVLNWLRPAATEFNITYNHGHPYEPDFVVETEEIIYLVEVKAEGRLRDTDVIAKKERAVQYCEVASRFGKANGYKEWQYLFIPANHIHANTSFLRLAEQFTVL